MKLSTALAALLGPSPVSAPAEALVRALLVDEDVLIHLHEDPLGLELALSSTPGRVPWPLWPHTGTRPWWDSQPHPDHPQASSALRLDPDSRALHLIERWPRAALDAVTLCQQLQAHAQRHRAWRQCLAPAADERPPADGPFPWGVDFA